MRDLLKLLAIVVSFMVSLVYMHLIVHARQPDRFPTMDAVSSTLSSYRIKLSAMSYGKMNDCVLPDTLAVDFEGLMLTTERPVYGLVCCNHNGCYLDYMRVIN